MPINISAQTRKSRQRAAADAASLLNYHPNLEAPPAWALARLRAFPAVWAHHVYDRLHYGYPAPDSFPREEHGVAEEACAAA